mmetsp:Transcript_33016/g.61888  ORF Transcript_33016/g.61888 Transcript_33016/m.61888 type:complete len:96 (-) Transcript_33016:193-480(-)
MYDDVGVKGEGGLALDSKGYLPIAALHSFERPPHLEPANPIQEMHFTIFFLSFWHPGCISEPGPPDRGFKHSSAEKHGEGNLRSFTVIFEMGVIF